MGFIATAIALAAVTTAGATIYSANESSKAQKQASNDAQDQQNQQNKLISDAKATQDAATQNQQSIEARDAARAKQKAQASAAQGRQGTILTSPLGVPGQAPGAAKTILGG